MSKAKILKLKTEVTKMESVYSKSSTSDKTKAILKKAIDKAKGEIEKLERKAVKKEPAKKEPKAAAEPKTRKKRKKTTPLERLKSLVKRKKYSAYSKTGVDLEKDAGQPALPTGKRTSKSGKTYYEYRANRIDVKQPPKRYPKLEDGGETSDGKIRFDMYGYIHANNQTQDGDEIIRVSSYKEAEEKAENFLKENKYELVELYRKDDFVGSIRTKKNFAYSSRYKKEDFADGGQTKVGSERMYNFLKDDLAELENDIKEGNKEGIERFFSYWNVHLKSLEPKSGSSRMYNFLKEDLVGLEEAVKEMPFSEEEIKRFFSYWNQHLKSLNPANGQKMADGGKIKDQYDGREPEDIWNNLSKMQRQHFIYDHASEIEGYRGEEYGELKSAEIIKAYNSDYDKLDKNIKNRFNNHVRQGQYKGGGSLDIDSYADGGELKKDYLVTFDSQTQDFQPTTFQASSIYDLMQTLRETVPAEVEILSIEQMTPHGVMEYGGVAGY